MENVLNWFKVNKLVFWRIVDKTTGSVVAKFDDEENTGDSTNLLSQNLTFLRDGKYAIFARKNIKGVNGELEFPFTIGKVKESIGALYGAESEGSLISYILKIEELKREIERKDFEAKLEKFKIQNEQEKPDMLDKLMKTFSMVKEMDTKGAENAAIGSVEEEKLAKNLETISKGLGQDNFLVLAEKLAAWVKMSPDIVKKQLKESGLL